MPRPAPTLEIQLNIRASAAEIADLQAIATHVQATGIIPFCSRSEAVRHAIAATAANARAAAGIGMKPTP